MKTAMIARFVMGAAAIFAVGCSAETGQGESGSIGFTSEALAATPVKLTGGDDPADLTAAQNPLQERKFASSCKMKSGGVEYFVVVGGFSSTPTAKPEILLAPANGAFVKQAATVTARGDGAMIAVSDTECWFVGGATAPSAATAQAKVDVLTFVAGTPNTIAVNAAGAPNNLNQARSNHRLSICVDNGGAKHVVAVGGLLGGTGPLNDIEVSPAVANITTTAWTRYAGVLSTGRYNFGLAKEQGSNNYLAAAGFSGLGAHDLTMDAITMSSSCVPTVNRTNDGAGHFRNLPTAIEGNVAYPESNANTFQVAAGRFDNGGTETLYATAAKVVVTNWATGVINAVTAGSSPAAGTYRPVLVETDPTAHGSWALVGGSNAAIGTAVTTVQHFVTGSGFAAAATGIDVGATHLGLFGGVAEYFPNTAPASSGGTAGILIHGTGTDFNTPLPLTVEGWK